MLISVVLPIMTLYHLPQGQYGYSGHVINLPQDVASFASSLPRHPTNLDVVVVRKEHSAQSHRDFHVKRSVVLAALQWLVSNNIYYNNISIDTSVLAHLPEDGNLSGLCTFTLNNSEEQDPLQEDINQDNVHTSRSFVPAVHRRSTESETIRQLVHDNHDGEPPQPTPWPSTAINEFTTEGYMTCAFPTLFPTGAADFLAPRVHAATVGNFLKHPRFRYFALNTEMRWRALQAGRVYVQQHPNDDRLTVDDLRDMVGREGEAFSNRVLHYASSLRGTRQYWSNSAAGSSPWWTPLAFPLCSLHTVQLITSGQILPVSSVPTIPTLLLAAAELSLTTQPSVTGSSAIGSKSLWRPSMLVC